MIKRESAVEGRGVHPGESLAAPRPTVLDDPQVRPALVAPAPTPVKPEPVADTDPRIQLNVKVRTSLKERLKNAQRKAAAEENRDVLLYELVEDALEALLKKRGV
ncbi:hypothetical protein RE9425_03120 [Prescottella equi]|nr:hypothetical protein RE9425_03120 [Prescottella equi]